MVQYYISTDIDYTTVILTGTYAVVDAVHEILKFLLACFCRAWPALHPQCALFQFRLQGAAMVVAALLIELVKLSQDTGEPKTATFTQLALVKCEQM